MTAYVGDGGIIITVPLQPRPRPRQSFFIPWKMHRGQAEQVFRQEVARTRSGAEAFDGFWRWAAGTIRPKNYTPADHPAKAFQAGVRFFARQGWKAEPCEDLLFHVDILAAIDRPKGHYGTGRNAGQLKPSAPVWMGKRGAGDNDNIEKTIWDALSGIVWKDDAQVVSNATQRRYILPGEEPMAIVRILIVNDSDTTQCEWATSHIAEHKTTHAKPF